MAAILPLTSPPSPQIIHQCTQCLQKDGLLAVPTDSFYALAVSPFHPTALARLMHLKGGRDHKPFPVLIGNLPQLNQLALEVPDIAKPLMTAFWPGLLTLIFPALSNLSTALTGDTGTIGLRQPGDLRLCQLLEKIGPVTGTSANRTGDRPATTAAEIQRQCGSEIDLILDGGPPPGGEPSTVLQLKPELRILRQGAISREQLEQVLAGKSIQLS